MIASHALTGNDLRLDDVWEVAVHRAPVALADKARSQMEAARALVGKLEGFRVDVAEPTETIGKRIRAAELEKIPFVVVLGDRESEESLAIRERGGEQTQESLASFVARLATLKP